MISRKVHVERSRTKKDGRWRPQRWKYTRWRACRMGAKRTAERVLHTTQRTRTGRHIHSTYQSMSTRNPIPMTRGSLASSGRDVEHDGVRGRREADGPTEGAGAPSTKSRWEGGETRSGATGSTSRVQGLHTHGRIWWWGVVWGWQHGGGKGSQRSFV